MAGMIITVMFMGASIPAIEGKAWPYFALGFAGPVFVFGIAMAGVTYLAVPHVPALVGNLLWGTALFSQIAIPLVRGVREFGGEGPSGTTPA